MKRIILIGIVLFLVSCAKESDEYNQTSVDDFEKYVPPPIHFVFQFIDKNTGNDLFISEKLSKKNIEVTNEKGKKIQCSTNSEENKFLIRLPDSAGKKNGKYNIRLSKNILVKIAIEINYKGDGLYQVKSFKIEKYEFNEHLGIIQVKI